MADDIIDTRDIIAQIEELEARVPDPDSLFDVEDPLDADEEAELSAMNELLRQVYAATGENPRHGATLILDSYFEDYARQYAEDIGAISKDAAWPASHIDWEAAAAALQTDYATVEWRGFTFWVR